MKKLFSIVIIAAALLTACNEKKAETTIEQGKIDTINQTIVEEEVDSFPNVKVDILPEELKDDSVFADGSIPSSWENAGITDVKGLKEFLKNAQLWVMNNNKEKLAAAIKYPLKDIKNEAELVAAYNKVFTKEVKLSFATINFNQIFRNQKGVMLENGKVWINQFGKEFKIFAIN